MTTWEHVRSVTEWARFVGLRGSFNVGAIVSKGRAIALLLLASCSIPLGKSAREDCEAINQAAEAYFARCSGAPAHEAERLGTRSRGRIEMELVEAACIGRFDVAQYG